MIYEIIVLNRIYKTNLFSRIKARVHSVEDKLVFVQNHTGSNKPSGALTKVQESDFGQVPDCEIQEFFDLSDEDVETIRQCHNKSAGIEGQIYQYSILRFAHQALQICLLEGLMNSDQVLMTQYWVKEIYLGLMNRRQKNEAVQQGTKKKVEATSSEDDASQSDEETELSAEEKKPQEALDLLEKVDRYLLLHQFLTKQSDRVGFADVFLMSMVRRGDLRLVDLDEDQDTNKYVNILRLTSHMKKLYPSDPVKLDIHEANTFQNIHHLTSSYRFLEAVNQRKFEDARQIAQLNPWAVRAKSKKSSYSAAHFAVLSKDMEPLEILKFLETLDNFDFDLTDEEGESPLQTAIYKKRLDLIKFFVSKGADIHRISSKGQYGVVYVAACLGNVETLQYFIDSGCDVNHKTKMERTALTKACWMGREDSVAVLLKHPKTDINLAANEQRTALCMACWGQNGGRGGTKKGSNPTDSPECARLLLEAGADPEIPDDKGRTPLIVACQTGATRSISILLEFGVNVNAVAHSGATALHTCMFFGIIENLEALLGKHLPEGISPPKLDDSQLYTSIQGNKKVKYLPIMSSTVRDCFWIWNYLIKHENELREKGYKQLTIGKHNFQDLLRISLYNQAFKCLLVLLKHYQKRQQRQSSNDAEETKEAQADMLEVDLCVVLSRALTVNKAPRQVICQLYELLLHDIKSRNRNLSKSQKRELLIAFCASQVSLIDTVDLIKAKTLTQREKYTETSKQKVSAIYEKESGTLHDWIAPYDEVKFIKSMLNDLLDGLEYVPSLAVKFCCYYGKTQTLDQILQKFPQLDRTGSAFKTVPPTDQPQTGLETILRSDAEQETNDDWPLGPYVARSDETYVAALEEISPGYEVSPLQIGIMKKHESVVRLILDETTYDLCSDITSKTSETCIHLACRVNVEMSFLQFLLSQIRIRFDYDNQRLENFLNSVNSDGFKASDFCWLVKRRDKAVVLQEFVHSSEQQVIKVINYQIYEDYPLNGKQIDQSKQFQCLMGQDTTKQYKSSFVAPFLMEKKGFDFRKSLKKQVPSIEDTPFQFIDTVESLSQAAAEIRSVVSESGCNVLAVDLEYHQALDKHATLLCLMQLSTVDKDYVIDSLVLRDKITQSELRTIFEDQTIVKIFHGSDSDLQLLASDLDIVTINVFDTARAYQYLQRLPVQIAQGKRTQNSISAGHHNVISLVNLVKQFLEIELSKFFQVADWRIRPLPKGMEDYARCDTHFLIPIYAKLQMLLALKPASNMGLAGARQDKNSLDGVVQNDSPFSVFEEIYFSEQSKQEQWYRQLVKLSGKTDALCNIEEDGTGAQLDCLNDLAQITNEYVALKLTKNNFKKVVVQF